MNTAIDMVPVRRSVVVEVGASEAFDVFTQDVDGWWPRTHHVGTTAMVASVIEPYAGGRCYTRHEDGAEMVWGTVTTWNPPRRLVLAWHITHDFKLQADPNQASEVEVEFTMLGPRRTRVDLEHRLLERHATHAGAMRRILDGPNGWATVLAAYSRRTTS